LLERFYWQGSWLFAIRLMAAALVPLVVLSSLCAVAGSRAGRAARRGWHFGALLLGDARADRAEVALHLRRWAVKGFFTAFMLSILPGGFADVVQTSPAGCRAIRWRWPTG
jgi:hypothetical protein